MGEHMSSGLSVKENKTIVCVFDPSPIFQIGLQACLDTSVFSTVFLASPEELSLVQKAAHNKKHVFILGPNLGDVAPFQLCRQLSTLHRLNQSKFNVIIVSSTHQIDDHYIADAVHIGASACLPACFTKSDLLTCISQVVVGRFSFERDSILRSFTPLTLTLREIDVVRLLARQKTNAEVAEELKVSVATVCTNIQHIFEKLHVKNREAAVLRAHRRGLI